MKKDYKKELDDYGEKHREEDYAHDEPTGEHLEGDEMESPETDMASPSGRYLSSREDISEYEPEMEESHLEKMKQYNMGGMTGYAEGGKVGTGDRDEDAALAKDVLHKMVGDMEGYEAYRIHPMKPEHEGVKNPTANDGESFDEAEPENSGNQHDLNPKVLSDLLHKAESAHEDGSTKEDMEEELPEEIRSAVNRKRKVSSTLKETR